jgi:type II secretory pathway pseudopilin PulG
MTTRTETRPNRYQKRRATEDGDTLLEVLIALVVLSMSSVAIILAFATSIASSAEQRNLSSVDTVLRGAAQEAASQMQQDSGNYFGSCPAAGQSPQAESLQFPGLTAGYSAQVTSVLYWDSVSSSYDSSCTANASQLVAIVVTSAKGNTYDINTVVGDPLPRAIPNAGAPTHLVFIGEPGNGISGSSLNPQPIVAVEDTNNNVVTTDLSTITLTLNASNGATLSNCVGSEFYGVVTFSHCSVSTTGSGYTITATDANDGDLTSSPSSAFSVTAAEQAFITPRIGAAPGNQRVDAEVTE